MIRCIIVFALVALFLILGMPVLGILWILKKFKPELAASLGQHIAGNFAIRFIITLIGVKVTVRGVENVPKEGGVLFVSNHRSYYDIVSAYVSVPRQVGFIAKDALSKVPALRRWMQLINCHFLNRKDIRQGLEVIKAATEQCRNGGCIWICPEGTRNKSEDSTSLLEFHEASFKIAERSGCVIVPVAFYGTDRVWEKQFPRMIPYPITVEYGKPFTVKELGPEWKKKTGLYTAGVIRRMLEEEKNRRTI